MRLRHSATAGLLAGALALSLVAAESAPAASGAGTASTRLVGAEVRVTGPLATPTARLLDVVSSATTEGTPVASTSVVPIAVGDDEVGATGASSSGDTSGRSDGGGYGDLAGPLGLVVQPIETSATATADRALATVGAATGQLSALLGAIGLDLDTTGVSSLATRDGAAATQGLTVSGLDLSLGDLGLGADVLGQLGLDQVLALLDALPGIVPTDLDGATAIFEQLDALDAALADLGADAGALQATVDQLTIADGALPGIQELDTLLGDLEALSGGDATAIFTGLTALAGTADAVGCTLTGLPATLVDLLALADPIGTITGILDAAVACVTGELDAEAAALAADGFAVPTDGTELLAVLTGIVDDLAAALPDELAPVLAGLDAVVGIVEDVLAQLGDLDGLLDQLPDLLANASGLELLEVGAFDVGTTAVAGATAADSSAVVLCEAVDVAVLGEAFTTPDCSDALDQLPDVAGQITAAVDQLTGVLNTLPLGDLVEVGELRADVFTDLVEQVTEADGVVTATAGFNLLDLAVPSVTLDPSQVTDALGGLGLPDVVGTVEGLLGDLETSLGAIDTLPGVGDVLGDVTDALASVGAPDGLTDVVDTVTTTIDGLALGELGTLTESISTPGLELLIDPVSTASFAAAADGGTAEPAPTPTPDDSPTLPSTGGGLALMGVLALAGAGALRRRR